MNNEFEEIGKKAVVVQLKVLSPHLPGGTEENDGKPQESRSPDRDLNLGPPEYETGVLTTQSRRSAHPVFIYLISIQ
jgi:hypothetical protein